MSAPASIENVSVVTAERVRLSNISLHVERGSITAVIGANGSGKSTLLGVLAAEVKPSAGSAFLDGEDVRQLSGVERARRRALLSQDSTVNFGFRVRDVVSWGRTAWRGTAEAAADRVLIDEAMADQGIEHLADRPVAELSGGERKRVHIARVLCQRAPVLLLDEADGDLDLTGRAHLDASMVALAERGTAIVVVSHDIARISHAATRIVALKDGSVAFDGPPSMVLSSDALSEVYSTPVTVSERDGHYLIIATS